MQFLFKIFYLGSYFFGFQRQPNGNGVENHLEMAFIKAKLINSFIVNRYNSVSRTDRGVNAIMNCFQLELDSEPDLKIVNGYFSHKLPIVVYDFARIDREFNPRQVRNKLYRYYLSKDKVDGLDSLNRIFDFQGNHDFYNFIKPDGAGAENSNTTIYNINLQEKDEMYIIDIKGDKFGREQIRRMIGYILDPKFNQISPTEFLDSKQAKLPIKPAPPQSLVLISIEFLEDIKWIANSNLSHIWNRLIISSSNYYHHSIINNEVSKLIKELESTNRC